MSVKSTLKYSEIRIFISSVAYKCSVGGKPYNAVFTLKNIHYFPTKILVEYSLNVLLPGILIDNDTSILLE